MHGESLTFDGLRLRGSSRGGDETWLRVDPPGLALDVGRGAQPLIGTRWIFISHGHLDHCAGLPWILSQRKLQALSEATVLCPREVAEDIRDYLRVAGRLENEELGARVIGLEPGEAYELEAGLRLETFRAPHPVPALGCHLIRREQKLRDEFKGLVPGEIADLKRSGVEVTRDAEHVWLSYTGDTGVAVFANEPRLFAAKILVVECTFLGDRTRGHGERFGHLHLEDLAEFSDRFENEAVVLVHLSRRHRAAELESEVARRLPGLAGRVHLITGARGARGAGASRPATGGDTR